MRTPDELRPDPDAVGLACLGKGCEALDDLNDSEIRVFAIEVHRKKHVYNF